MAGELEAYIDLFGAADKLYRTLHQALTKLHQATGLALQDPRGLANPSAGNWPTQDQIREMYQDFSKKMDVVYSTYQQLPHEYKKHAPNPESIGHT